MSGPDDREVAAAARPGAVPPLRFAPSLQPDARGSRRRSPFWRVPEPVKAAVWQRDDHTCRYCGFCSLRYQEVLVGGGNSRDPDQMGTVCQFCHQCLHLGEVAAMRSGVLLWLPEIPQTDLNWMVREIYLARLTRHSGARARRALDLLLERRAPARDKLGTDDPTVLGRWLREASLSASPDVAADIRPAMLPGIRLLALDRRILRFDELEFNQFPQVLAYWRSAAGPYAAQQDAPGRPYPWVDRLEAILVPAADSGDAAAGLAAPGETDAPIGDDAAEPPSTHARLAARLLRDAAAFFRTIADQNPGLNEAMSSNAEVYEQVAVLLQADPWQTLDITLGDSDEKATAATLGAQMLRDAAGFFESVGEQNPPLAAQMKDNASVYRDLAGWLVDDPDTPLELD